MASPEEQLGLLLRERNRRGAAACAVTRSYRALLAQRAQLQAQCVRQQQRAEWLAKENHEMRADLQLLRQNEANAGVSREHIELLQQQLDRAKSELALSQHDCSRACAREAETLEAAKALAERLALAQAEAAEAAARARAEAAALRARLEEAAASEARQRAENERLLRRVTDLIDERGKSLDSEVEAHYSEVGRLGRLRLEAGAGGAAARADAADAGEQRDGAA
ncbi:hypothetical protein AB1Y20_011683 [Prymnesium parvum]|uniref:Coiled-coil domain-containing protein 153 n=1 Tax=Prymnesium parvum TaxID=97485 RepID=A0AB34IHX4_PRYPA